MKQHQYWDVSFNPVTGCTPISDGCTRCWARSMVQRFPNLHGWTGTGVAWDPVEIDPIPFERIRFHPDRLNAPIRWKKPRTVFVCDLGDLFHDNVDQEWQRDILHIMDIARQHIYLLLTKRPENMARFFKNERTDLCNDYPHIWIGTTVESEKYLHRVETLLQIPAAKRWLSVEPMLGPINIACYLHPVICKYNPYGCDDGQEAINWVVIGAESGPNRRPCKTEWIIDLVRQCKKAHIPVWVKQIHDERGKVVHDINQFPEELRVRERP